MKKTLLLIAISVITSLSALAQWSERPEESLLVYGEPVDKQEMLIAPNGNTWVYYLTPENGVVATYLQLIDSLGNKMFGEDGLMVSGHPTRPWNTVNNPLYVDRDGNAIVAVHDIRNAVDTKYLSYTLYKISQEGEFLWGEDGLALEGTQAFPLSSHISITQIDDKSYVCAWGCDNEVTGLFEIKMQRISQDGELLWDLNETMLKDPQGKVLYTWPTVIDAGMNQVILIYFRGSNFDMYARKIDFDGQSVWSEDTRLYDQGWPASSPAWSLVEAKSSGDGGVLVAWTDDRFYQGSATYLTYVMGNGEIGFVEGIGGQRLTYGEYLGTQVTCAYDPHTDSFLAVWREAYSAVMFRTIAQRLSKYGELLWGEEGLELHPFTSEQYGYFSIQTAPDGQAAFFYMHNQTAFNSTDAGVTLLNTDDPTIRQDFIFTATDSINLCEKSGLISTSLHNNSYWNVMWQNAYITAPTLHMQRINVDLTLGVPAQDGVQAVESNNVTFSAVTDMIQGSTLFAVNTPADTQATLAVYNVNGALVATPFDGVLAAGKQYIEWNANVPAGIYIATLTTAQGVETVKLLVK